MYHAANMADTIPLLYTTDIIGAKVLMRRACRGRVRQCSGGFILNGRPHFDLYITITMTDFSMKYNYSPSIFAIDDIKSCKGKR